MSIIEGYLWAENRYKLERAITEVKEKGLEINDENVKTVYVRLLGVVIDEAEEVSDDAAEKKTKKGSYKKKTE